MRMLRRRLLVGIGLAGTVLVACPPILGKKNLNNPNKIGRRTVAHRSVISPEKEIEIGKQVAAWFESTVELVGDSRVERYVTSIAQNLVRNSDFKGSVTVRVVRSPDANSTSLPGGFIYVNSGLLVSAENEDEIAGAIAHQVAHAASRSWASEFTRMTIAGYATLPFIFGPHAGTPPPSGASVNLAACSGFLSARRDRQPTWPATPLMFLKYQREDELEADYLGLQYMYKAGYDPTAYVALLRKLAQKDATAQRALDSFQELPPVSQRIAQAEEEIRKVLPNAHGPNKSSSEFIVMKSRL